MSEEKQALTGDEEANKASQENNVNSEATESQHTSPEETPSAGDTDAEPTAVAANESAAETPIEDKEPEAEISSDSSENITEPAALSSDETAIGDEEAKETAEVAEPSAETSNENKEPAVDTEPDTSEEITEPAALSSDESEGSDNEVEAVGEVTAPTPVGDATDATTDASSSIEETPEADATSADTTESTAVEEQKPEKESQDSAQAVEATNQSDTTEEAHAESAEAASEPATEADASAPDQAEAEQEEVEEEIIDYSGHTREQLAEVVDELSKQDNFKRSDAILSQVLPLFKGMARARRQEALDKFLEAGGERDDFEYRHDEVFNRFDASVRLIRDRRANYYKEREARKESNYQKKLEILDKLRELIDGENATTNLSPIKALQEEWKALGPVPAQHNRTLWANYNALLDRFYNNRHILFELKELDRKKNLVKKTELCEKAEALDKLENIKDAIVQLNELHEEYKKIGAVPREVQEELWQRFKTASDAIYKKRKSYLEELKGELHQNLEKKRALAEELKPYLTFDSDRINDWNAKTKEILAIQKKWDAMGGLPREHAKEVNKAFWSAFKTFFSNKNAFFKKLEGMRHENLQKKEELVAKADALKDNTDWDKTSEALKALQRQWKEIGPVPEKFRNSVYAKFKEACDAFFNNRRASQNKAEAQYVENQKHKEDLINEVNERAKAGGAEASELDDIMVRWSAIGFVPRGAIKTIEEKFAKAVDAFVNSLDVPDEEREALVLKAELSSLKKGPNSDRRLNKKEAILRKQIQELEDNINLWNTNLAFFANSKTADKLKAEFDEKIAKAEEEIAHLKKQLKLVRSM